jgi:hypothetical protein
VLRGSKVKAMVRVIELEFECCVVTRWDGVAGLKTPDVYEAESRFRFDPR